MKFFIRVLGSYCTYTTPINEVRLFMKNELSYSIDDFDELRKLSDTIIDSDISININFTCFQCDCGNVSLFSDDKCSKCGQTIEKDSIVDPKVLMNLIKEMEDLKL